MGTSTPAVAPPPETVAAQFTKVYYNVAAHQPHRLAELYGADSEVSHVAGTTLTGVAPISAASLSFPLANQDVAIVNTLDAMHTVKSGYVVVVTGTLNGMPFTQTFVLDTAGDGDSKEHFYCRNDIFRFVSPGADKPAVTPADVLVPKRAQPVQVNSSTGPAQPGTDHVSIPDKTISANANANPAPVGLQGNEDGSDDDGEGEDEDDAEDDDGEGSMEEDVGEGVNQIGNELEAGGGSKGSESSMAPARAQDSVTRSAPSSDTANPREKYTGESSNSSVGSAVKKGSGSVKEKPDEKVLGAVGNGTVSKTVANTKSGAAPKPSAPKSWASIVSSSSPPSIGQNTASPTTGVTPVTSSPGSVPAGTLERPADSESRSTHSPRPTKVSSSTELAGSSGPSGPAASQGSGYQQGNSGNPSGSFHQPYNSHHNGNAHGNGPFHGGQHHGHYGHHNHHGPGSGSAGGWNAVDSKRHGGGHHNDNGYKTMNSNGHHGHHGYHSKHANARTYGPSAVIQLSSLPSERCSDWRALQHEFSTEFRKYGHEVRNIEVKVQRGLAFVEYDTLEGVRAAVSAWADGPRDSGPFKGIALSVSEKRTRRTHMMGGDHGRGGGRGSIRGGGRGGGRGRGRGAGFTGGNSTGGHASTVPPTAASS